MQNFKFPLNFDFESTTADTSAFYYYYSEIEYDERKSNIQYQYFQQTINALFRTYKKVYIKKASIISLGYNEGEKRTMKKPPSYSQPLLCFVNERHLLEFFMLVLFLGRIKS